MKVGIIRESLYNVLKAQPISVDRGFTTYAEQVVKLLASTNVLLRNRICLVATGCIKSSTPEDTTDDEASILGRQLSPLLLFSTSPKIAADAWFHNSPILESLDTQTHGDFMNGIHILVCSLKSNHGLRIRVTMGAILSVLDITSDIYMTIVFLSSEDNNQHKFGYVTLGMIGVCVFLQLSMVIVQYAKFSLSRKLLESSLKCSTSLRS
ncbi:hypothetical protein TrLO_g5763 [Triparma laevis f. longispina]|uniref:Uncharacterized protein n=1 Tax=Triparma laevis f. longispina TaxID=1714387 RepID=A0A9W7FGZ5_9STRA|nr:hypothetical protein TrLO_g5763 [Triparma laevis f. longispina]